MSEDEIILTHILQCKRIDLLLNKPVLTPLQQGQFDEYRRRRKMGEPLQYILGTCNFMGLELSVNSSVLVPRPETEQLVDEALKCVSHTAARILDLGTGSGNIAIALANFLPESRVVTIDASAKALEVARANAIRHKVNDRILFIEEDMLMSLRGVSVFRDDAAISERMSNSVEIASSQKSLLAMTGVLFDLVISNPPYIPTHQLKSLPVDVQQEPMMALDGGEDGLKFYRNIIKYSPYLLRDGACLMMEFGDGQEEALREFALAQRLFSHIEILQDLAGRDRIIKAIR